LATDILFVMVVIASSPDTGFRADHLSYGTFLALLISYHSDKKFKQDDCIKMRTVFGNPYNVRWHHLH